MKIIFAHSPCFDGFMSLVTAYNYFKKSEDEKENIFYLPFSNSFATEKFVNVLVSKYRTNSEKVELFFLDMCPAISEIDFYISEDVYSKKIPYYVTVIDHHITNQDKTEKFHKTEFLNMIFNNNMSGCTLTFKYFNKDEEVPLIYKYIEARDIFKKDHGLENFEEIISCIYGENQSPQALVFEKWLENIEDANKKTKLQMEKFYDYFDKPIEDFLKRGKEYEKYRKYIIDLIMKKKTFIVKFRVDEDFYTSSISFGPYIFRSDVGNRLVKEKNIDFAMFISPDETKEGRIFNVANRSINEKTDVSKIASYFGSGGHRNAAGYDIKIEKFLNLTEIIDESNFEKDFIGESNQKVEPVVNEYVNHLKLYGLRAKHKSDNQHMGILLMRFVHEDKLIEELKKDESISFIGTYELGNFFERKEDNIPINIVWSKDNSFPWLKNNNFYFDFIIGRNLNN